MNALSLVVGFVSMLAMLTFNVVMLSEHRDLNSNTMMAMLMLSVTLAVVFGAIMRVVALAVVVRMLRGASAIEWCLPEDCTSFSTWVSCSWNFFGAGGQHEGIRFCGLEIALQGTLGIERHEESRHA